MSEKFKNVHRKVKERVSFFVALIPTVLSAIVIVAIMLIVVAILRGAIINVCWNVAMTTMFGFKKITVFQAFVLSYAIGSLRKDFISDIKSGYAKINGKVFNMIQKEKVSKILSAIFMALLGTISIFITVWVVMYSWNNILPNLLDIELCHIDFAQTLGFAFLFNLVFGISKSEDTKSKNEDENGDNTIQTDSTENI